MRRNHSSQREAIYHAFTSTTEHPSAKTIYENLKKEYPNLSLGTVYRNIGIFKGEGRLIPICTLYGEERLDGDTSPHAHLVCESCGKIEDIPLRQLSADTEFLYNKGFRVNKTLLTYYGKCSECSNS